MKQTLLFMSTLFLLSGCSTTRFFVKVDSISVPEDHGKKIFVIANSDESELVKANYSEYVQKALSKAGYLPVSDVKDSDLVVMFSYGIQGNEKIGSRPTYQWVAPKTYSVQGTTAYSSGRSSYTNGTVQEAGIGSLQQTGTAVYSYTEFTRIVIVSAYTRSSVDEMIKKKRANPVEVWNTKIISSGSSGDLRKVFPFLMGAGIEFFGKNTPGQVNLEMTERDPRIQSLVSKPPDARTPAAK